MRTLDQILTKKDYSRKTPASLFYKDSPLWQRLLTIGCVVFLSGAGLGEWKVLNGMLGGLPKAISLGVDRKSTRLNSSHKHRSRMPSSA